MIDVRAVYISTSASLHEHDQRLAFLYHIRGELRRVSAADVPHLVGRSGGNDIPGACVCATGSAKPLATNIAAAVIMGVVSKEVFLMIKWPAEAV